MLYHEAKWKGVDIGHRAFVRVKKEFPNINLVLWGARREAPHVSYDEYVYKPKQKNLAEMFSSCHIFDCRANLRNSMS